MRVWDCVSTLVSHGCMHAVTVISLTFSRLGLFRSGTVACVCILPPAWPRPKHLQRALAHPGQMINYARTEWYGLGYLLRLRGSAFPRCIPPALIAAAINYVFLTWPSVFGGSDAGDWLGHPYTFQLVGIVFGYLMVTRINMSYSRYWEGVTMVKQMHSKWADACGQIIAFDRSLSTECNLTKDPFCCHIVRLFSQMSAMATMRLHIVDPGESLQFDAIEGKAATKLRMPVLPTQKGVLVSSAQHTRQGLIVSLSLSLSDSLFLTLHAPHTLLPCFALSASAHGLRIRHLQQVKGGAARRCKKVCEDLARSGRRLLKGASRGGPVGGQTRGGQH